MPVTRTRFLLAALTAATAALCGLAETGTPYPAGTDVEVSTPGGTVAGVLVDRTTPGWVMVRETGRKAATAIPEKSIAFVRPGAERAAIPAGPSLAPQVPGTVREAAPDAADHAPYGLPRVARPERFAFRPEPGAAVVDGVTVLRRHAFTVGHYVFFPTL